MDIKRLNSHEYYEKELNFKVKIFEEKKLIILGNSTGKFTIFYYRCGPNSFTVIKTDSINNENLAATSKISSIEIVENTKNEIILVALMDEGVIKVIKSNSSSN